MTSTPALIEDPNDPGTFLIQNIPDALSYQSGNMNPSSGSGSGYNSPVLRWSNVGERFFEVGVDRGVLYLDGMAGVAWNGLISVSESPSGGEAQSYYLDGVKHINRSSPEEFAATLEAFTYPDAFATCDGTEEIANGLGISQQRRKSFGLSYRTLIGNDLNGTNHAYKIHILYNALAQPSEKEYLTLSEDSEPSTFSWEISTRPVKFEDPAFGVKYGAHLVLDSRVVYPWALEAVEKVLYGTETTQPRLPTPQELLDLFVDNALLKVLDNGDGTYTITGPDEAIVALGNDEFEITWDSVIQLNEEDVQISSL